MSDALIIEYLSAPRSSKRGGQSSSHNDNSATNPSTASSNNHSNARASVSGRGGEGKRGSLDWIRGLGRKA